MLARAALSHVSLTLLANRKDWRNIHHALGHSATSVKFVPASALSSEVLSILNEIVPARSGGYNETASGTNDLTGDPGGFIGR